MPVIPFTDLSLSKLSAEKQTRYLCAGLPGFGILVGKRKKTFFVMHGKERRIETLGKYPTITLKVARLKAVAIIDGTVGILAAQDPDERVAEYVKQLDGSARYKYEQNRLLRKYLLPKVSDLNKTGKADILKITDMSVDVRPLYVTSGFFVGMSVGRILMPKARYQHAVDRCEVPKCEGKNPTA